MLLVYSFTQRPDNLGRITPPATAGPSELSWCASGGFSQPASIQVPSHLYFQPATFYQISPLTPENHPRKSSRFQQTAPNTSSQSVASLEKYSGFSRLEK